MEFPIKISVLGTEYTIQKKSVEEDPDLVRLGGYCMYLIPKIVICDLYTHPDWKSESAETIDAAEKNTVRHEIIHAFLNESGLAQNTISSDVWSQNEEMVDWMAIQFPKIMKVYKEVGCI